MAVIWSYAIKIVTLHVKFIYTIKGFESRFSWDSAFFNEYINSKYNFKLQDERKIIDFIAYRSGKSYRYCIMHLIQRRL
jgi:hypothetical protein